MADSMNDDQLNFFLRRDRRERFLDYTIGAVIMLIITGTVALVMPLFPVALNPAPVKISSVNVVTEMPVCPGDTISYTADIVIREPAVVAINVAFYKDGFFIPGSVFSLPPLPRPESFEGNTKVSFVVPDGLAPGDEYRRVSSFVSSNSDTKPAFLNIPFTIAEDCQ